MDGYKEWVKRNSGLVGCLDYFLARLEFVPSRDSVSESRYVLFSALAGAVTVYHNHILNEPVAELSQEQREELEWEVGGTGGGGSQEGLLQHLANRPGHVGMAFQVLNTLVSTFRGGPSNGSSSGSGAGTRLNLELIEHVVKIVELRGIYLEQQGKMSRYGPLVLLELVKACLRMSLWEQQPGHILLLRPQQDYRDAIHSENTVADYTAARQRFIQRHMPWKDPPYDEDEPLPQPPPPRLTPSDTAPPAPACSAPPSPALSNQPSPKPAAAVSPVQHDPETPHRLSQTNLTQPPHGGTFPAPSVQTATGLSSNPHHASGSNCQASAGSGSNSQQSPCGPPWDAQPAGGIAPTPDPRAAFTAEPPNTPDPGSGSSTASFQTPDPGSGSDMPDLGSGSALAQGPGSASSAVPTRGSGSTGVPVPAGSGSIPAPSTLALLSNGLQVIAATLATGGSGLVLLDRLRRSNGCRSCRGADAGSMRLGEGRSVAGLVMWAARRLDGGGAGAAGGCAAGCPCPCLCHADHADPHAAAAAAAAAAADPAAADPAAAGAAGAVVLVAPRRVSAAERRRRRGWLKDAGAARLRMGVNLVWLSQLMHIWRPVVYVSMLYRNGRHSWGPWGTSLALELLGINFHTRGRWMIDHAADPQASLAFAPAARLALGLPLGAVGVPFDEAPSHMLGPTLYRTFQQMPLTGGEIHQIQTRKSDLWWYALRSPFLDAVTRPLAYAVQARTQNMPIVGFGVDYLINSMDIFCEYYSYISSSST
ncbi:MAG: hypothetical protein WDW36_001151 [Sanguina aurantia]